jgi:uncharacterized protein
MMADALSRALRWVVRAAGTVLRMLLVALIRSYQAVVSPMTGPSCRYYPSCSQYALVAVQRHGPLRGSWLAAKRLARCHPWAAGGVDDVPPVRTTEVPAGAGPVHRARSSDR